MGFLHFFALAALLGLAFAEDPMETFFCNSYVRSNGYKCTEYQTTTSDGYILNLQRVGPKSGVSSPQLIPPPPPTNVDSQLVNELVPLVEGLAQSRISTTGPPTTMRMTERRRRRRGHRKVSRVADPPAIKISGAPASPPESQSNPPAAAAKLPTGTQPPPSAPKYPIFLDHALFFGGDIWFDGPPPSTRLPFLLADAGFDVYVGQHRATKYSPDSTKHPRTSFSYWDFSFDDLAKYDLPPLLKLVQGVSGIQRVHYIGFNQGGILPLAALASDPSFDKNLASLTLIGPITFLGDITSPVLNEWGTGFSPDQVFYNQRLVNGEYNLTNTQNLEQGLQVLGVNIGDLFGGGSTTQLLNNVTRKSHLFLTGM